MGFLSALLGSGRASSAVAPRVEPTIAAADPTFPASSISSPDPYFLDWANGGQRQEWGPAISERTAMCCSAVYRCVTLEAGLAAGLSLKIYRTLPNGQREEAPDHRLTRYFRTAPFPGRSMTAYTWRELWLVNVLLWGNHYSIVRYDNAARVIGFEPVMPWLVQVFRRAGRNLYHCTLEDGREEYVDQEDMLHLAGPGFDGIRGLSRIQAFSRNAISLAQSLEERVGRAHENGATPGGVLAVKARMSPEAINRQRAQFHDRYGGRANAGRVVVADEGSTYTPFQMSLGDLQTIEQRRYQVADISRFYGTPMHLLNETDKSTSWGSGLAENTLAFLIFTIDADLKRIEAEINYKLFDGTDFYAQFDRDTLLAMDPVKSAEVAQTEIASGTLLINERRRMKNRPPVEGGDTPLVNSTNIPLTAAINPPEPAPAAPPPALPKE